VIDGPFLLELREEDFIQVLGVSHKLHVKKIMISREKLKPLSEQEQLYKEASIQEDRAAEIRQELGVPDVDTVFSQARNGRIKRVEESINLGMKRILTLLMCCGQRYALEPFIPQYQ
jgi:hypothetical protein